MATKLEPELARYLGKMGAPGRDIPDNVPATIDGAFRQAKIEKARREKGSK